ncbi:MAG TPA: DUF2092 domain-containing protein [Blastocatellia bacterium]|nr:DUF2092 domain-containing protein [Blastocatellia bacterium]
MHYYSPAEQSPVHPAWLRPLLFSAVVIFATLVLACNRAPEQPMAVNNDPDQLLRQMSEKLAQAKKLSFKVDRKLDPALVEDRNVAESAQIEISVSRPNKFLAKSDSKDNVRHIFFDGQNLSIYDETMKLYANVPVPGTIDDVVAKVDEKYGFTPPLAEFILSDTYRALSQQIKTKAYKGKENIAGVECHHLTLGGDVADSELWIGSADLLPRKLVATFKNREGSPQLQADFSNWNLAAPLDDNIFAFVAPKDAEKIEMVTEAQMKEAAAKEGAAPESTAPQKSTTPNANKK